MSPNTNTLAERVLTFIQRHSLIGRETLIVGVSGGPDSVCLLHLLAELKEPLGVELHIAHLNHMLRSDESEADAEYVSRLSRRLGIAATIEAREVESYHTEHHLSIEEAAREVRYQFFADVASSVGVNRIVLGHTKDDQVETILMHLLRGTGAYGLQGMRPLTTWKSNRGALTLVRPLLEVGRRETEAYCREHCLYPRTDSSNLSTSYLRNRVRHELIPQLQSYNPNVTEALIRAAHILAGDLSFFEQQISEMWDSIVSKQNGVLAFNTKTLAQLHPALQRYLIREVLKQLLGSTKDIEWKHIENIISALSLPPGKRLSLPKGLILYTEYGKCLIAADPAALCPLPPLDNEYRLKMPGETQLPGWQVITTILQSEHQGDTVPLSTPFPAPSAYLDSEKAGEILWVRQRKPGDTFQPLGMAQPKKLQDFMVDAKIPQIWRDRLPLVCSPQHILWVVGWRIDERVKVAENTEQVLCLQFLPL